jgi:hypothetical protein
MYTSGNGFKSTDIKESSESEKNKSIIIDESMMEKRLVLITRGFGLQQSLNPKKFLELTYQKKEICSLQGHLFHHS